MILLNWSSDIPSTEHPCIWAGGPKFAGMMIGTRFRLLKPYLSTGIVQLTRYFYLRSLTLP